MTNSIILRDRETLSEIVTVNNIFNASIEQRINDLYTAYFEVTPNTENAWQINHPNVVEIDGDYFIVRKIPKRRTTTTTMSVDLEHISYELNKYNREGIETNYEGTADSILSELLYGTGFTSGTVHDTTNEYSFKTTTEGLRNRIIEFANTIGAEVKFDKLTVSLLARRGNDHGLKLEVGKNLIAMTETEEVSVEGEMTKSYEVEVVDLYHVQQYNDLSPEELQNLYDIYLGDTVTLIDNQFGINHSDRICYIKYDPFQKALPSIEFLNKTKDLYNSGVIGSSVGDSGSNNGSGCDEVTIMYENKSFTYDSNNIANNVLPFSLVNFDNVSYDSEQITVESDTEVIIGVTIFALIMGGYEIPSSVDGFAFAINFFTVNLNVDNTPVTPIYRQSTLVNDYFTHTFTIALQLSAGTHSIDLIVSSAVGTVSFSSTKTKMYIKGRYISPKGKIIS